MTLRQFIDAIFSLIGASSLTDLEYAEIPEETIVGTYDQALYEMLAEILVARDAVSNTQERLIAFFKVKNVDVAPVSTARSNILAGLVLE